MEALRQAGIEFEVIPGVTVSAGRSGFGANFAYRPAAFFTRGLRHAHRAGGTVSRTTARDCGHRRTSFTAGKLRSLRRIAKRRNRR